MSIRTSFLLLVFVLAAALVSPSPSAAKIWDSVPDEQIQALGLNRDSSAKELFDAVEKRWRAQFTKGKFAQWWEPIELDQYLAPTLFYKPPEVDIESTRAQCVECHTGVTHGWVKSWEKSVHANLDSIRQLPADDVRAYKKEIIAEVEDNLRTMGKLGADTPLKEVGCIDCHMGVGRTSGHHVRDLRPVSYTHLDVYKRQAVTVCTSRYGNDGLKISCTRSTGTKRPSTTSCPAGVCIQLFDARIQNDDSSVPSATR